MGLDIAVVGILYPSRAVVASNENICSHSILSHVSVHAIPTYQKVTVYLILK